MTERSLSTPQITGEQGPVPSVLGVYSSTSIEIKPEPRSPTSDRVPAIKDNVAAPQSLWEEAKAKVNETPTRKWIGSLPALEDANNPFPELVAMVRLQEEQHIKDAPKLKIGEREVLWRDYAERVVDAVTTIGDITIDFALAPSVAICSGVKVLLKTNVTDCKDLVAIMGCTEIVLQLVKRSMIYEEVYVTKQQGSITQELLKQQLIIVYTKCLELLAFVDKEVQSGYADRFLDALLKLGYGEERLSELKNLGRALDEAAHTCEAKAGDKHRELLQSLEFPVRRVDNNVTKMLRELGEWERTDAMNCISEIPVDEDHIGKCEKRTKGTCEWLPKHSRFRDWEDSECSSLLWLQGNMGTGKTYLSSKIIDRYLAQSGDKALHKHDEGFAYFYCSNSDPSRQGIDKILRSYMRQLSEVPGRPGAIHSALFQGKDRVEWWAITVVTCKKILQEIIDSYPRTILVLDALDECDRATRKAFLDLCKDLVQKSSRVLKIFITSRPETDIQKDLESFQSQEILITISTSNNRSDVKKFVDDEMEQCSGTWSDFAPSTRELVKETLVDQSGGIFRWTSLQWEQLKDLHDEQAIQARLRQLPTTLSKAYDEIMGKFDAQGSELKILRRAIKWVTCARKALDSCTLITAIKLESEKVDGEKLALTEQKLESICRHLIVRDMRLGAWKFSHASVLEYFQNRNEDWFREARQDLTIFMINSLKDCCSQCPSKWPPSDVIRQRRSDAVTKWFQTADWDADDALDPRHPYQTYVQQNWIHHVQEFSSHEAQLTGVSDALKVFIGDPGPQKSSAEYQVFARYILRGQWHHYTYMRRVVQPIDNNVFGIIAYRLHKVLAGWWDRNLDISVPRNGDGFNLLQIAIESSGSEFCKDLPALCKDFIQRGLDVNQVSKYGDSAMKYAITGRHLDLVRLLLDLGADANSIVPGSSYLCTAALAGVEYVQVLLEAGANLNIQCSECADSNYNCHYGPALFTAAGYGELDVMRFLVENGANVNFGPHIGRYGSPLSAAVTGGHLECVRYLVDNGADVNSTMETAEIGSPLATAAVAGNLDLVRYLVDSGAKIDTYVPYGKYSSAVAAAALGSHRSLDVIKYFVDEHNTDLRALLSFIRPRISDDTVCYCVNEHIHRMLDEELRRDTGSHADYRQRSAESSPCKMAAYLVQEIEPELLVHIGFDKEAIPPLTSV
ncbi:hypothetical protein OPT61_g8230 [Boeremia exigua]|uniref:Uncharacterized protein n=1 Tax=Boeremia exigua TaxID=749465 RepID=A0ACC2I080_9PLEO|nr:hypothetical protein OPT61_g8230 [Boeremia exigua]